LFFFKIDAIIIKYYYFNHCLMSTQLQKVNDLATQLENFVQGHSALHSHEKSILFCKKGKNENDKGTVITYQNHDLSLDVFHHKVQESIKDPGNHPKVFFLQIYNRIQDGNHGSDLDLVHSDNSPINEVGSTDKAKLHNIVWELIKELKN